MGKAWLPQLDNRTVACLKELPWWSGYTEDAATEEVLLAQRSRGDRGAVDVRPKAPKPLPPVAGDYLAKVMKPQLHKCSPKTRRFAV